LTVAKHVGDDLAGFGVECYFHLAGQTRDGRGFFEIEKEEGFSELDGNTTIDLFVSLFFPIAMSNGRGRR